MQLNTDLLKQGHQYLYKRMMAWFKLNEIRSMIKSGEFNKDGQIKVQGSFLKRVAKEVLQWNILKMFTKL